MASVSALGHCSAGSDFTAAELSLTGGAHVHCQMSGRVIWVPERGLHCLWKPGHCHTTSLAARLNGIRKLLKWSNFLLEEVTGRENVFYFSVRLKAFGKCLVGFHSYIFSFSHSKQKLFKTTTTKITLCTKLKIKLQVPKKSIWKVSLNWFYLSLCIFELIWRQPTTDDMQLLPCCRCHS